MFMKQITVLLAEDHQIVRQGFRSLLKHEPDIEVVGEAETGRQAVRLTRKLRPEVVVMDIGMPLLNGLEATRQIRKDFPDTKVLILSAHSDDAYVEQVTELGAAGFLLKCNGCWACSPAANPGRNLMRGLLPAGIDRPHEPTVERTLEAFRAELYSAHFDSRRIDL